MKNFLLAACLLLFVCLGCSKQETGCTPVKPQDEKLQIMAYASKDSINATEHSSGIYYQIINPGSGPTPTHNSKVFVTYTGKFLNDTKFDESTEVIDFYLRDVIEGWQLGIPLIKKGGRIKLIIPSAYAYGCNPKKDRNNNVLIPANSVLFFDVSLVDVQ